MCLTREQGGMSDDEGGSMEEGGAGGGNNFFRKKQFGPPQPKWRPLPGKIGTQLQLGSTPITGPFQQVPTHKVSYPAAGNPVYLQHKQIAPVPGPSFDFVRSLETSGLPNPAPPRPSLNNLGAVNHDSQTVDHTFWLAIPATWLENNPDSLVDLKVNGPEDIMRAVCISFILKALSEVHLCVTNESNTRAVTLANGTFVGKNGEAQPRATVVIHTITAPDVGNPDGWEDLLSSLPRDSPNIRSAAAEDGRGLIFTVNDMVHPARKVGWLVQYIAHDPTLHPNALITYEILNNRQLKCIDTRPHFEANVASLRARMDATLGSNQDAIPPVAPARPVQAPPAAIVPPAADAAVAQVPAIEGPVAPEGANDARSPPAPEPLDASDNEGEAEEVDEDEELDEEEEAKEAAKVAGQVYARAEARAADKTSGELARKLATRLAELTDGKSKTVELFAKVNEDDDSDAEDDDFDPTTEDHDKEMNEATHATVDDAMPQADDTPLSFDEMLARETAKAAASKDAPEPGAGEPEAEEVSGEDEDEGEIANLDDDALDSEEERELAENSGAVRPKRKAAIKAGQKNSGVEDMLDSVRAQERAILDRAEQIRRSSNAGSSRIFNIQDYGEKGEKQHEQEKKTTRQAGATYLAYAEQRQKIAMKYRETDPFLFGRMVFDLQGFSQLVVDPYLRAAGSELSLKHPDGLYDLSKYLSVAPFQYNALDLNCPLNYTRIFSFKHACDILKNNLPGRVGSVPTVRSPQFDYESYCGTIDDPTVRVPFPHLGTIYRAQDLDPETLAGFKPPGALSAVDAIIDETNAAAARHQDALNKVPERAHHLYEHPKAPLAKLSNAITKENAAENGGVARPEDPSATLVRLQELTKRMHTSDRIAKDATKTVNEAEYSAIYQTLERMSTSGPASFAQDAIGIESRASVDAAVFGTHAMLSRREVGSGRRGTRSTTDPVEAARFRERGEADQMAWLEKGSRVAQREEERATLLDAVSTLRAMSIPERSKALGELTHPVPGSRFAAVSECCKRVLSSALSSQPDGMAMQGGGIARRTAGGAQEVSVLNTGAQMFLKAFGNHAERTAEELSITTVIGPIDKLSKIRRAKYNELVSISVSMPYRTDTEGLIKWLDKECPHWLADLREKKQMPSSDDAAQYGLAQKAYAALRAMTHEREERLRRQWLADAMVAFRAESSAEVCSILSVNNSDLSDSYKGILVWLMTRPLGQYMVRPVFSFDPTMSPFATAFVRDCIEMVQSRAINEDFVAFGQRLMCVERLSHLRTIEGRQPDAAIIMGPPGCGKSVLMNQVKSALPSACVVPSQYRSRLAAMTGSNKEIDHKLNLYDETPACFTASANKFDPSKKEDRDREKSMLTSQEISYIRNVESEDGTRKRENRVVRYHHNMLGGTNFFSAESDMADRVRLFTSMALVQDTRQGSRERRENGSMSNSQHRDALNWQHERFDEALVVGFMETMIAGLALPEVNIKLFTALMSAGEACISRWISCGTGDDSGRPKSRGESECRQYTLFRSYHVYFRSEASCLLHHYTDIDPNTGKTRPRISFVKQSPFYPRDISNMMQTSLCATYGEAIPAYYSLLTQELLPLDEWRLLISIAAVMMGFTRDYFDACYYRYGIELPDILSRMAQRKLDGVPDSKSRRDACSFLDDYYDFDARLRKMAYQCQMDNSRRGVTSSNGGSPQAPRPLFITARQLARIFPSASDNSGAVYTKGDATQQIPDLNPSVMIRYMGSAPEDVLTEVVASCKPVLRGFDEEVVKTLLMNLCKRTIRVPWHRAQSATTIEASSLSFEGISEVPRSPDEPITRLKPEEMHGEVLYRNIPLLKFGRDVTPSSTKFFVAIPTFAVMVAWPELYYMALSAHEGPHTRTTRCVIPAGYTEAPSLMQMWTVKPNKHGSTTINTSNRFCSETGATSERIRVAAVLPGDDTARDRQRAIREKAEARVSYLLDLPSVNGDGDGTASEGEALTNTSRRRADKLPPMDVEMREFVKFLEENHYVPPQSVSTPPSAIENISARYAYIARFLLDAPGNVERRIQNLRNTCPDLKNDNYIPESVPLSYPDEDLRDTLVQNALSAARADYDLNPDAAVDLEKWNTWIVALKLASRKDPANEATWRLAEEVRKHDEKRIATGLGNKHEYHAAVHVGYRMWLTDHLRQARYKDRDARCRALAANNLGKTIEDMFKHGYDVIYDYLKSLEPGGHKPPQQKTLRLKSGRVQAIAPLPTTPSLDEEDQPMPDKQPQVPNTPPGKRLLDSDNSNGSNLSDEFDQLRKVSASLPLRPEVFSPPVVGLSSILPGAKRSKRAMQQDLARRARALEQPRGGEDDAPPSSRRRTNPRED